MSVNRIKPLGSEVVMGVPEATPNMGDGLLGEIHIRVFKNARPEYTFTGKIGGGYLNIVQKHLRKAYVQHNAGLTKKE